MFFLNGLLQAQTPDIYYPFTGNANDAGANRYNGTVLSTTLTTDMNGNPNSAYFFNAGSDVGISLPNFSGMSLSSEYVINMLIMPNTGCGGLLLSFINSSGKQINLGCGVGFITFSQTNATTSLNGTSIQPNVWNSITVAVRNLETDLYINGSKVASMATNNQANPLPLAGFTNNLIGQYCNGVAIDEVKIFNQSLTDQQIMALLPLNQWTSGNGTLYANGIGNIGIGTSTPSQALEVVGNIKGTKFIGNGSQLTGISGLSQWVTNSANIYFNTGNVGIGTTSPQELLHINGNIRGNANGALKINTGNGYIVIGPQNTSWAHIYTDRPAFIFNAPVYSYGGQFSAYSTSDLTLQTAGTTRMAIRSSNGNVGIGTISPSEKLEVTGNIKATKFIGDGSGLTGITGTTQWTSNGSDIYYNAGNIGIGTITPSGKLQIVANETRGLQIDHTSSQTYSYAALITSNQDQTKALAVIDKSSGSDVENFRLYANGDLYTAGPVCIGKADANGYGYKLAVAGSMIAEEVVVKLQANWPDFVFAKNHPLKSLSEIEQYIKVNNHLPEIPSASEVKQNGVNVGDMQNKLLQKVEEMTLYMIDLKKENEALKERIQKLEK